MHAITRFRERGSRLTKLPYVFGRRFSLTVVGVVLSLLLFCVVTLALLASGAGFVVERLFFMIRRFFTCVEDLFTE